MIAKTTGTQNHPRKMSAQPRAARPTKRNAGDRTNRQLSGANETGRAQSLLSLQQELDTVRREHGKLQQAIYEAAQIQRKLCAPREMQWGEFEIAGESFAVRHLTGDFFKVLELESVLGIAVGDIAGKGLSAGIWQAHMLDLVKRCAQAYQHPAEVVASINRELYQDAGEPPITALFYARLDPNDNELVYCNAGLPAPLLLRINKSVERLEEGGPMLGAIGEATYKAGTIQMNPGDMLLAYSDGLTECRNVQDEEFEIHRLIAAAKAISGANASQVLFSTLAAVLDFAESCPSNDDLTLLVARCRESVPALKPASTSSKEISTARRRAAVTTRSKQVVN